ncbi:MAG: hypothetical protein DRI90_28380, partial [Deltaproteobacteria bacterium]
MMLGSLASQASTRWTELPRLSHPKDQAATYSFAAGDLDGDGDQDFLVGKASGNSRMSLLINDGRGHLVDESAKRLPFEKTPQTVAIAIGDVDGDGDLDAFVGQETQYSKEPCRLLINDGKGFFVDRGAQQLPTVWGTHLETESARFADLDRDGDLDLCYVNGSGGLGPVVIYWNDGKGRFSFAYGHVPPLPDQGVGLAVGDIDGDKDIDLVYGTLRLGFHVLVNNGKKLFSDETKKRVSRIGWYQAFPELADVDGDGDLDLIVAMLIPDFINKKPAQTALYLNDGKGFFKEVTATQMPKDDDFTTNLYVRDFDADGDQDILVVNMTIQVPGTKFYANDGRGFFTDRSKEFLPVGKLSDGLTAGIADLDGDGDLDLIGGKMGLPSPNGPVQDVLVWNTTRHLYAPGQAGTQYPIDVWGPPGQYAFLWVGLGARRVQLPGLGVLELDLSQALLWPQALLLPKSRKA